MQGQVPARIQFPVMGNNDILVVLFIPCLYRFATMVGSLAAL